MDNEIIQMLGEVAFNRYCKERGYTYGRSQRENALHLFMAGYRAAAERAAETHEGKREFTTNG